MAIQHVCCFPFCFFFFFSLSSVAPWANELLSKPARPSRPDWIAAGSLTKLMPCDYLQSFLVYFPLFSFESKVPRDSCFSRSLFAFQDNAVSLKVIGLVQWLLLFIFTESHLSAHNLIIILYRSDGCNVKGITKIQFK